MKTSVEAVAYHEAGHAIMAWLLNVRIRKATIVPDARAGSLGHVRHEKLLLGKFPEFDNSDRQRIRIEKLIVVCLAGPIAQVLFRPRSFRKYHASSDWKQAVDLSSLCNGSDPAITKHLAYLEIRTRDSLQTPSNRVFIECVAKELVNKHTLSGKEVSAICREAWKQHRQAAI